jgi:hypothetical protein
MCTTSTECNIVMTVMLTVKNGMDPHMISGIWDGFGFVWSKWVSLGRGSVMARLHDAIEVVTLRR